LTEAAQIADRWKGYCEDLYCGEERKGIEPEYRQQKPPPLRSEAARAIHQAAGRKATGPDEVPAELFKAGGETEYVWQSGKLVSGQRNGRTPLSSHFSRKVILNSVQITEQLLLSPMQARSFFGSYWKGSERRPKRTLQMNRRVSDKEGGQEIKSINQSIFISGTEPIEQ